ncbi:hypothetical protein GCM10010409_50520 [Mycolicibacterium diernhoferi]
MRQVSGQSAAQLAQELPVPTQERRQPHQPIVFKTRGTNGARAKIREYLSERSWAMPTATISGWICTRRSTSYSVAVFTVLGVYCYWNPTSQPMQLQGNGPLLGLGG